MDATPAQRYELAKFNKPQICQWFWIDDTLNIADWITRGRKPWEICVHSIWQVGPVFMYLPFKQWPIPQKINVLSIPEQIRTVMLISDVEHSVTPNNKVLLVM